MADPSDLSEDVTTALRLVEEEGGGAVRGKDYHRSRRVQAVSLALAGIPYDQIAERLRISVGGAHDLVKRTLREAENRDVPQMRSLENARLDRAQAGIWSRVLEGDIKAVDAYLRISRQRSLINGLDAPTKIDMNVSVKYEMEQALRELEEMVTDVQVLDDSADPQTEGQMDQPFETDIFDAEIVEES